MDAKELHEELRGDGRMWVEGASEDEEDTILRALSLLAAAEANDGTTPETDAARLTINQRRMIAEGRGVVSEMVEASVARRLERERNGLARELAAARRSSAFWKAEHIAGNDVIERLQAELAKLRQHAEAMAERLDAWARIDECKCSEVDAYRRDYPEGTK